MEANREELSACRISSRAVERREGVNRRRASIVGENTRKEPAAVTLGSGGRK